MVHKVKMEHQFIMGHMCHNGAHIKLVQQLCGCKGTCDCEYLEKSGTYMDAMVSNINYEIKQGILIGCFLCPGRGKQLPGCHCTCDCEFPSLGTVCQVPECKGILDWIFPFTQKKSSKFLGTRVTVIGSLVSWLPMLGCLSQLGRDRQIPGYQNCCVCVCFFLVQEESDNNLDAQMILIGAIPHLR